MGSRGERASHPSRAAVAALPDRRCYQPVELSFASVHGRRGSRVDRRIRRHHQTLRDYPALCGTVAASCARACGDFGDVLQVLTGDGKTGAAVVQNVDCICFTGSVPTGRRVAVQEAGRLIPAFLELGGKDPLLILPGANLTHAVEAALRGSVLATGQACQSIERVYVHRSLYTRIGADQFDAGPSSPACWPDMACPTANAVEQQAQITQRAACGCRCQEFATILSSPSVGNHAGGLWLQILRCWNGVHAREARHDRGTLFDRSRVRTRIV